MEKAITGNVAGFVDRRLHPVRLSIGHLNRLLDGVRKDQYKWRPSAVNHLNH